MTLLPPETPQCTHELREAFNALRWLVKTGVPGATWPGVHPRADR
ncbi:hypothetical protein NITHO_1750015 [Nitrolancea hollandica Lb]|uniref:Uncharacterized protein n=1 Tax=Nitrolancea hollandica Lb TaxID=1129897 RepID=I4EE88_9BACT|nr:hypothetical protein NITHO_1750015 [Nitrolancea hollandica Lb]